MIQYQASGYLLKSAAVQASSCASHNGMHQVFQAKVRFPGFVLNNLTLKCLWPFLTQSPKFNQHFGKLGMNIFLNWLMFQECDPFKFLDMLWMVQNRCRRLVWSNRFQFKIKSHLAGSLFLYILHRRKKYSHTEVFLWNYSAFHLSNIKFKTDFP